MGAQLTGTQLRPLIGVSASEIRDAKTIRQPAQDEPAGREAVIGCRYIEAIALAGGIPVMIPPIDLALLEDLLDERIDGICIPGGMDVDPRFYGAEPDANLGPTDPDFDEFELALLKRVAERKIPLVAICRGVQVLNVSRGGTLIQHLPDHSDLAHRQQEAGDVEGHSIELDPESRLASLTGTSSFGVNTYHHQAIDQVGSGLRVVARAPDGVIEAVEEDGLGFVLGLQWHAELMAPRDIEAAVFAGLVEAASEHARRRQESLLR